MSGTSMDGLDCVFAEIYLDRYFKFKSEILDQKDFIIPEDLRRKITNAVEQPGKDYSQLHEDIGSFIAEKSSQFLKGRMVDCAAMHGQTIFHVERVKSIQIGNPSYLAEKLKVPVIYHFRDADINAGGTGAPLMPFLDWLLLKDSGKTDITLNIGGVANVTVISKSGNREDVAGFDTGPGMALIDECCQHFWQEPMDKDGKFSKIGTVNQQILNQLMSHPFIHKDHPKSTGRDVFGREFVLKIITEFSDFSPFDILRTFVAFTAKSISVNLQNLRNFSPEECRVFVSGGGSHHPLLIKDLYQYTGIKDIDNSVPLGVDPDFKEALLMAVLGVARLINIRGNMPSVTGANSQVLLGKLI